MSGNAIVDTATKLGLNNSPKVLRKAQELYQLSEIRISSQSLTALNLTGLCPVVMCLDLAASQCGHAVNKTDAVRLSGVNKKVYSNGLKAFESMMELQGEMNIKEMAVQFGCTGAVTLATESLQSYIKEYNSKSCAEIDFETSLFQAASLCAACRKLKIKVDRVKLKEVCSVKNKTFDRLVTELEKHAEKIKGEKKMVKQKRSHTLIDEVERQLAEDEAQNKIQKVEQESNPKQNYEEWKKKMLEAAAKATSKSNKENGSVMS